MSSARRRPGAAAGIAVAGGSQQTEAAARLGSNTKRLDPSSAFEIPRDTTAPSLAGPCSLAWPKPPQGPPQCHLYRIFSACVNVAIGHMQRHGAVRCQDNGTGKEEAVMLHSQQCEVGQFESRLDSQLSRLRNASDHIGRLLIVEAPDNDWKTDSTPGHIRPMTYDL